MARKLESFPTVASQARYPWDEWLNGDIVQLFAGEDYSAKTRTIVSTARTQAKRRGGNVRTRLLTEDDRESVVLQFRRTNTAGA